MESPQDTKRTNTHLLDEVFEAEKATRELLDTERAKAARWLDETKRSINQATDDEIARLNARAAEDQTRAKDAAAAKALEIVRAAQSLAERVAQLEDTRLLAVIGQHLAAILPRATP